MVFRHFIVIGKVIIITFQKLRIAVGAVLFLQLGPFLHLLHEIRHGKNHIYNGAYAHQSADAGEDQAAFGGAVQFLPLPIHQKGKENAKGAERQGNSAAAQGNGQYAQNKGSQAERLAVGFMDGLVVIAAVGGAAVPAVPLVIVGLIVLAAVIVHGAESFPLAPGFETGLVVVPFHTFTLSFSGRIVKPDRLLNLAAAVFF